MLWIILGLLTLASIAGLGWPLLRPKSASADRAAYDLTVYKDQLGELERELERGTLPPDQAEAARLEIQRRILALAGTEQGSAKAGRRVGAFVLVLALLPLLGFGFYAILGRPWVADQPFAARKDQIKQAQDQGQMIRGMVAQLESRLAANPDDGKGWAMLGRSQKVLGQTEKALESFQRALILLPKDTQVRLELASLILDQLPDGAPLSDAFVGLMTQVNRLDPTNADAQYFLGVAAIQRGDVAKARMLWTKLAQQLKPGSEERNDLERQIKDLP